MRVEDSATMGPHVPSLAGTSSAPGVSVAEADLGGAATPAPPFRASRFGVDVGHRSRVDRHAAHECWMVAAGEGTVIFEGRPFRIRGGDVCYFPPFTTHQAHNDGAARLEIFSVWWSAPA